MQQQQRGMSSEKTKQASASTIQHMVTPSILLLN
jgi:hypothetical protein